MNKKKIIILWCVTIISIIATIYLNFAMNDAKLKYEKVEVTVLSSKVNQVVNRKTKNRTNFYKVKVDYKGKSYDLGNVHSLVGYSTGRTVQAYLYNQKLYANIEGVKTSTPVATIYFIFLFGSFALFCVSVTQSSKYAQAKKNQNSV